MEWCQSNFFNASLIITFLKKCCKFSISFGIKFKWFILAHKVLYSQASAYLFSIACLPTRILHFSQIGLHAGPWMCHDDSCLRVSLCSLPCEKPSPSARTVIGSVLKGPFRGSLYSWSTPCLVSPFPPLATLYSSHIVLECAVFLYQPWFYSCHALASWNYAHPSRTILNTAMFSLLYKPL